MRVTEMDISNNAFDMLAKHALCDHCLGRQFALLGHGIENEERGKALKLVLTLKAHVMALLGDKKGIKCLKILATNGFFVPAKELLQEIGKPVPQKNSISECYLCENTFKVETELAGKAIDLLEEFEYNNFLVGTELPSKIAEREDEFRAEFNVQHGENMRNEFGRLVGKRIADQTKKDVEFKRPEMVVLIKPFAQSVQLQPNPLFVSGRYRKLVRDIPQSKWFCSTCHGHGCEKCGWTGKMYQESVQEIIEKPFLEATGGLKASFHASGREDIDARMLGRGRPFVIEITKPKKRFLDLERVKREVNASGKGKVQVSRMKMADKLVVQRLKKSESTQKEYRVLIEFEKRITDENMLSVEKALTNVTIRQQTPLRVVHRRADLTREKYIYEVNVKKLSPKKAEMKIRCQGGLYVKELVTGDEGRTVPNVSTILNIRAKPKKLDVLSVAMEDQELMGK
jgi:tRNA pseudouridine synthase 10